MGSQSSMTELGQKMGDGGPRPQGPQIYGAVTEGWPNLRPPMQWNNPGGPREEAQGCHINTPPMGVQLVDSDFKGPLPADTVGLILRRSSVTMQGLIVHPGVIDSDYIGQVKIMVFSPRGIVANSPGDHIAQLLLLPSCLSSQLRRKKERTRDLALLALLPFFAP